MRTLLVFLFLAAPGWAAAYLGTPSKEDRARDRAELVRPAPPNFKPRSKGRKISLHLTARDKKIRVGEKLWYRLAMQNIGSTSIFWAESTSFFKQGIPTGGFGFFVRTPDGKEVRMHRPIPVHDGPPGDLPFPPGTSEKEKKRLIANYTKAPDLLQFSVELAPGEKIVTRPWSDRYTSREYRAARLMGKDPDEAIPGDFRELPTMFKFEKPGVYFVQAIYADIRQPLNAADIKYRKANGYSDKEIEEDRRRNAELSLGTERSNWVKIIVVP